MKSNADFVVLTLDAGGTNFVFSALKNGEFIGETIHLPASTNDQMACANTLIDGFEKLKNSIDNEVNCISFAFPGPADYENGIIGDLPNFPGIKGKFPLKQLLQDHFKLPVYINNDGDLFAYGEALGGVLPQVNKDLATAGTPKTFKNLIGITLGTGFGCGIVINKILLSGDNSCAAEIHNLSNTFNEHWSAEESVSTRAIKRVYAEEAGIDYNDDLMPKDVFEIAKGLKPGHQDAAKRAFESYGRALGIAIMNVQTLIDGIIVIGGGITSGWELFAPAMFEVINSNYYRPDGNESVRTTVKVFDLTNPKEYQQFLKGKVEIIDMPEQGIYIKHDNMQRTGIICSANGASLSTSLGAYYFAENKA